MCSGKDFWHTKSVERLGVPSAMMCDGPHGLRKQKGSGDQIGINESIEAVCFPTASALAASFDKELLYRLGEELGDECQAEDVAMLLGPGINIKRSPLCGRNFEYYSEDPYLSGQMAAAFIKGLQSKGVASCVKHFAANNQETRRMSGDSQMDERTLHEIYLPAFEAAVKEGKTRGVMCSYNKINGTFSAENKKLLTGILREKWGFKGFVVTDWGAVKDQVKGLLAGLDLVMPGPGNQSAKIVDAVKSGELDEAELDKAVRNILKFANDYLKNRKPGGVLDIVKGRALSVEIAKECAVLLKNDRGVLPLSKTANVVFIGEFARNPRYQGAGSSHINVPHPVSAMEVSEGLNITYAQGYHAGSVESDVSLVAQAVEAAKASEAAVIFAGLPAAFETEGVDRDNINLPKNQNELIEAVAAVQPNTVVVLHTGAPVILPWADKVPSILNMYLGGDSVGAAEVDLLFGDDCPSGKIAETYPLKLADNPSYLNFPGEEGVVKYKEGVYVGYRYYDKKEMDVRFPFGHGMSYTDFVYSDIKLDKIKMKDTETLTVTCKVKNTGNRAGKEVVQLYVRDMTSTVSRPIRELKGFAKIALLSGEEKPVVFSLNQRSFAYYEPKIHDWFVESGAFIVEIGASSRDIRLSAQVEVQGTTEIPITFTKESTVGDLMKTEGGREFVASMLQISRRNTNSAMPNETEDTVKNLGEGSEKMMQSMMAEMPLSAIINFGGMSEKQLDDLLAALNSKRR